MPHDGLRERGIYRLPDGREVVLSGCGGGRYCVYLKQTWDSFGLAEYLLDEEGQIIGKGRPTGWRAEDLTDTALTAEQHVVPDSLNLA